MALKSTSLVVNQELSTESIEVNDLSVKGELYDGLTPVAEKFEPVVESYKNHFSDTVKHLSKEEHQTLTEIANKFKFVDENNLIPTASTPPILPKGTLSYQFFNDFFAGRAEPGQYKAPGKVYITRTPYAVKVGDSTNFDSIYLSSSIDDIPDSTPIEKFDKKKLPAKLMNNADHRHVYASDTSAGIDDYVGKEWAFWWGRANFIIDDYGNKHITAVKELKKGGHAFTEKENVGSFGPAFWFFCKRELYQFTDSNGNLRWTTETGEKDGQSFTQLWGISDSPWHKLSPEKQAELTLHGITESDFHIWPECLVWDPVQKDYIERPYWVHSAYFAGAENEEGTGPLVSKPNLPLRRNNLSHNSINALNGEAINGVYPSLKSGATACTHGFGILFDIIKSGTKHTQKYHSGMSNNYSSQQNVGTTLTYKAIPAYATLEPGYIIPIINQGQFEKYCTVYLESTQFTNSNKTAYRGINHTKNGRSLTAQVGRIKSIEEKTFKTIDEITVTSLCLVLDPDTVEPFVTRLTEEDNKIITDSGKYSCCYVQQGFALSGETDLILGKTDGTVTDTTNGRHPYRVQGTEYAAGAWTISADIVFILSDGTEIIEYKGKKIQPTDAQYVVFRCPQHVKRINNGSSILSNWIKAGYEVIGLMPATQTAYVANGELTKDGIYYILEVGNGANSANSFGDNFYFTTSKGSYECLSGGNCNYGAAAGSAYFHANAYIGYVSGDGTSRL